MKIMKRSSNELVIYTGPNYSNPNAILHGDLVTPVTHLTGHLNDLGLQSPTGIIPMDIMTPVTYLTGHLNDIAMQSPTGIIPMDIMTPVSNLVGYFSELSLQSPTGVIPMDIDIVPLKIGPMGTMGTEGKLNLISMELSETEILAIFNYICSWFPFLERTRK